MNIKHNLIGRMLKDESGATAIEYGLIVALVSMAAIIGYTALGTELQGFFDASKTKLNASRPK